MPRTDLTDFIAPPLPEKEFKFIKEEQKDTPSTDPRPRASGGHPSRLGAAAGSGGNSSGQGLGPKEEAPQQSPWANLSAEVKVEGVGGDAERQQPPPSGDGVAPDTRSTFRRRYDAAVAMVARIFRAEEDRLVIELDGDQPGDIRDQTEIRVSPYVGHDDVTYVNHPMPSQEEFYAGVRSFSRLAPDAVLTGFDFWPHAAPANDSREDDWAPVRHAQ